MSPIATNTQTTQGGYFPELQIVPLRWNVC